MTIEQEQYDTAYQMNLALRAEQGRPVRKWRREIELKDRYTTPLLSEEEYQALADAQRNQCAVCGYIPTDGKKLHVDHCHKTGRIRGLLCGHCNMALGLFGDDQRRCKAAAKYLIAAEKIV